MGVTQGIAGNLLRVAPPLLGRRSSAGDDVSRWRIQVPGARANQRSRERAKRC
jgi:hypothetical protein